MATKASVQQYTDFAQAVHDRDLLQNAGLTATLREVPEENSEAGYVHLLEVPHEEARRAYQVLSDYYESEKDEVFEFMGDWGEEDTAPGETPWESEP